MNVLVILGHPKAGSYCGALAEAYADGARASGQNVELLRVGDVSFDINYPLAGDPAPEPELERARELVTWADHLVFVFPTWWGTMPALLKGFVDRIFTPGYAFRMKEDGSWDKLLTGKSSHIITTMDTPRWVYRWIYAQPGINGLKKATLQFCGVNPVRATTFGTIFDSTQEQRETWLEEARAAGLRLSEGVPDRRERMRAKLMAWLRAIRLQFYPMTWMAYTIGAMAVGGGTSVFGQSTYWLGYAAIFLLEFATVLINEYVDYESDKQNQNFGPFNGGSRVLVDGSLDFREVRRGVEVILAGFLFSGMLIYASAQVPGTTLLVLSIVGLALCLGYTAPPFKFSYHGLGELDVAVTHSVLVVLWGYLLQGGAATNGFPWLVSLPLLLSILPAIMLSGVPDCAADRATGKSTLAVMLGLPRLFDVAMALTAAAALAAVLWHITGLAGGAYAGAGYFVVPHALWLLGKLRYHRRHMREPARINALMVAALTYILWFVVIPFINTI